MTRSFSTLDFAKDTSELFTMKNYTTNISNGAKGKSITIYFNYIGIPVFIYTFRKQNVKVLSILKQVFYFQIHKYV